MLYNIMNIRTNTVMYSVEVWKSDKTLQMKEAIKSLMEKGINNFKYADLRYSDLSDLEIRDANFTGADFSYSSAACMRFSGSPSMLICTLIACAVSASPVRSSLME